MTNRVASVGLCRSSLILPLWLLAVLSACWTDNGVVHAFAPPPALGVVGTAGRISSTDSTNGSTQLWSSASSAIDTDDGKIVQISNKTPSPEWELDCYSRPVMVNGKKLWEVLLTDANGSFRFCKTLPSSQVNSKELRRVVEEVIEESDVKPTVVRFFRGAMFNMINIALSDLDVVSKPSRCTFALSAWLEQRHRDVYPKLEGFKPTMMTNSRPSYLDVSTPLKLPDALRGEKYAFVGLPVGEFMEDGSIDETNIGTGRLCELPDGLPADSFVQGVVILTSRAKALASWLAGTEVVALTADLRKRTIVMETDIDTEYLMARLNDEQRQEGLIFEEGKEAMKGLHFISVQQDENHDPEGFWLLRKLPQGI